MDRNRITKREVNKLLIFNENAHNDCCIARVQRTHGRNSDNKTVQLEQLQQNKTSQYNNENHENDKTILITRKYPV